MAKVEKKIKSSSKTAVVQDAKIIKAKKVDEKKKRTRLSASNLTFAQ
jgi:hypothetical protein